jgi:ferredoxin
MYLLFSVRDDKDVVFKAELADLQARHRNLKVRINVSSTDGQLTRDKITSFVPGLDRGPVMLCGPDPMMTAMRGLLVEIGVPDAEIHQEAFISPASSGSDEVEEVPEGTRTIEFKRADKRIQITNGLTVLEAAEDAGVSIPYECRSGICGQCKTKLLAGRVAMDVQDALTPAEKSKGLILACQARAVNDIELDA